MLINFTKMHGLGNDFIIIDNTYSDIKLSSKQIVLLANRRTGIGFDQLLMVKYSDTNEIDFDYLIFNANGSEVTQCGNGARCLAHFVTNKGFTNNNPIVVKTHSSVMTLFIKNDNSVRVDMGKPDFNPSNIPLIGFNKSDNYKIEGFDMGVLSIGNPHCVILVNNVDIIDVKTIGQQIQQSKHLPQQANIGFMQILNPSAIKLRVFERGSGETYACGSGTCAAVIYGVKQQKLNSKVTVHLIGGDAIIEYKENNNVFLSGPSQFVFEGSVTI